MNRLEAELQRLYLSQDGQGLSPRVERLRSPAPQGRTRALVLGLTGPGAWERLAGAWHGVQADLQLTAPGIAINGSDGYQLWFSVAEPVPEARAKAFLSALRARYLAGVAAERVRMLPAGEAAQQECRIPPFEADPGRWSAFVAPDLAALFTDEPWLDVAPGADAQAELLSRLRSMKPTELEHALERLGQVAAPQAAPASAAAQRAQAAQAAQPALPGPDGGPAAQHQDPKAFLLAVMNDPAVALPLRIDAAKALLPYSER